MYLLVLIPLHERGSYYSVCVQKALSVIHLSLTRSFKDQKWSVWWKGFEKFSCILFICICGKTIPQQELHPNHAGQWYNIQMWQQLWFLFNIILQYPTWWTKGVNEVLWGINTKPKGLFGGHGNIRTMVSKSEQIDQSHDFLISTWIVWQKRGWHPQHLQECMM